MPVVSINSIRMTLKPMIERLILGLVIMDKVSIAMSMELQYEIPTRITNLQTAWMMVG